MIYTHTYCVVVSHKIFVKLELSGPFCGSFVELMVKAYKVDFGRIKIEAIFLRQLYSRIKGLH